eukprot:gene2353-biopygen9521
MWHKWRGRAVGYNAAPSGAGVARAVGYRVSGKRVARAWRGLCAQCGMSGTGMQLTPWTGLEGGGQARHTAHALPHAHVWMVAANSSLAAATARNSAFGSTKTSHALIARTLAVRCVQWGGAQHGAGSPACPPGTGHPPARRAREARELCIRPPPSAAPVRTSARLSASQPASQPARR